MAEECSDSNDPVDEVPESRQQPAEVQVEPDAAGLAHRLRAAARQTAAGAIAAAVARLPAVRAALVPRLPRLVVSIAGALLLYASFPSLNWWWAAIVAAANTKWPPRTIGLRILDREGREVFARQKGDHRQG